MSGICNCTCCIGNYCHPTYAGVFPVTDCSNCNRNTCSKQFPDKCPSWSDNGYCDGECSAETTTTTGGTSTSTSGGIIFGGNGDGTVAICARYSDSECTDVLRETVPAIYHIGKCYPNTDPSPSKLTSLDGNTAKICFYAPDDVQCMNTPQVCFTGTDRQCVSMGKY